ncbi:prephenate dehydratase [Garciella nitratireducens]|uniref:Prephenate dehydratase n=1 Tax=Garciella nitratireducens DSM 15102 TaxID=1121911 RepID=A0A1T4N1R0_9FIRM|nr:prephenate dehydratase [Garciella nitratireducens]SJZ73310.1 chorismate mutase [Garciella nitratireducens DSM 15102]
MGALKRVTNKKDELEEKTCKNGQIKVGYQGVEGSFSEQAMRKYFEEDDISSSPFETFEDVFQALKDREISYGILPIENSSTGGIGEVYSLLRKYDFYIVGEMCIKITQNLLGIKGSKLEDIEEVYSHPQGFEQSVEFLKDYPHWKLIPYKNTAISAKYIREENSKKKAAIASKRTAELYHLDIIQQNINFNQDNYTRFIIVSADFDVTTDADKISMVISLPHKPGSLYQVLRYFAENHLNMLKIESRPILDRPWEYFFYIDFEGNLQNPHLKKAIDQIEKKSNFFKLLGNYRKGRNINQ